MAKGSNILSAGPWGLQVNIRCMKYIWAGLLRQMRDLGGWGISAYREPQQLRSESNWGHLHLSTAYTFQ